MIARIHRRRLRVVQFVVGDAPRDARVMRSARSLRDAGHEVLIVGRNRHLLGLRPLTPIDQVDGMEHWAMPFSLSQRYDVILEALNRLNPLYSVDGSIRSSIARAISSEELSSIDRLKTLALSGPYALALASHRTGALRQASRVLGLLHRPRFVVRALQAFAPDVIHAHDLFGYSFVAEHAHRAGIPLIYDAHELESGRNAPTWSEKKKVEHAALERRLIGVASGVITVSPAIASILEERYGITRPTVVANAPPRANIRENRPLRERLGLSSEERVVLYLGGVSSGRGIERLLGALKRLPESVHLALMGPVVDHYVDTFNHLLRAMGAPSRRVHLLGRLPYEQVIHEAWGADVGYNGIEMSCESYRNALPNKFFEYVFAGVPVLSTPQTDVVRLTDEYRLGRIIPDGDDADIAEAIRRAFSDGLKIPPERRRAFIERFCWEAQAEELLGLYERIIPGRDG